jgi:cytochrome c biogenesis protein CcdA
LKQKIVTKFPAIFSAVEVLPLFVLAIFSSNIERLSRLGEWLTWAKKLMGWILLAWQSTSSGLCCPRRIER